MEINEEEAVQDIKNQLKGFNVKLLVFFASSCFNQARMSHLMQAAFKDSIVFGCSTAGEIANGAFLKNAIVATAFHSNIIADAKVEVIEQMQKGLRVEAAFSSFETYFRESCYTMDVTRYLGIVLIDGISMKEERLMDRIGNRSNVYFVGGSAGDDGKYDRTFVYANGRAYADSAVLVLIKMNDEASFDILKTQSYKALNDKLIATKVNEETREVMEFNNKPAILAYAEAVGASSIEEATKYFTTHPVGLIIGGNDIFVRSPRERNGTNIKFYCNLLQGMEVTLLEATDIVQDTKDALEKKMHAPEKIEGLLHFQCVQRTQALEKNNLVKEYGEIFKGIPNSGFSTYGEEYIGHMNQTSTMLIFKTNAIRSTSSSCNLEELADGILSHHERWHGNRYPMGSKGEAIPRIARILAIADSYAAMTSDRVYQSTLSKEEAMGEE
ncbi:FIST C-terminal domain-containing protein [Clostridium aminobutyricum]|uniref:FIST C-terminal domain-containing protein n=2 Tax=Clostridium aminobutyricum TaxID=33953 RepID=A0A939IGG4_CLOAM|nr:FIST C-terminal domain-containing protein [Clostridium aminobutyricum]